MVLVGVWPALPIRAADEVVSDCGDNGGPNQLRAKLAAMQSSGGGTLSFACGPATIVINATDGALPTITTITRINGEGITISGNNATRIFQVASGGALTLSGLTLTKGYSADQDGGAIRNEGTLTISRGRFIENATGSARAGGAILSLGRLTIDQSEFIANSAGNGGAVYTRFSASNTTIRRSRFNGNQTTSSTDGWGDPALGRRPGDDYRQPL
jgi:hypothetical protein